jgi:hypothetical protein
MIQREPWMVRVTSREPLSILLEARRVDIVDAEVFQNPAVGGFLRLVGQHASHFVGRTAVVALEVPAERAGDRILSDVERLTVGWRTI